MQMMINSDRDIRTNIAENILEANGDIVALSDAIFNNLLSPRFTTCIIATTETKSQLTTNFDTSIHLIGYFKCPDRHGIFVRPSAVTQVISRVNQEQNGPGKFSHARSHELNEAYMGEFEKGFEELRLANGGKGKTQDTSNYTVSKNRQGNGAPRRVGLGFRQGYMYNSKNMTTGWTRGPSNPAGNLFDASDRNILCMSMLGDSCVVGSADHGLKEFNINTCKLNRNLYSRKYGHSEWVTCVTYIPDGRILSGGMDSKLCLWTKAGVRCNDLVGHSHSVSCVVASNDGQYALSGGYDKSIRVWNLSGIGTEAACLMGHNAPIMCMEWSTVDCDGQGNGFLLTGSRDGMAVVWDLGVGSDARVLSGHRGHVTALEWMSGKMQYA